jgi:hypothetical protein
MSANVTFTEVALSNLRLWFLMSPPSGPPAASIPLARLEIQNQAPMISAHGRSVKRSWTAKGCFWLLTLMRTPFCRSSGRNCGSLGATLVWRSLICRPSSGSGLFKVAATTSPSSTTDATFPCSIHW